MNCSFILGSLGLEFLIQVNVIAVNEKQETKPEPSSGHSRVLCSEKSWKLVTNDCSNQFFGDQENCLSNKRVEPDDAQVAEEARNRS